MTSSLEIGTKPRDISCCIEEICISQLLAGVLCRCIHAKLSFNYLFIGSDLCCVNMRGFTVLVSNDVGISKSRERVENICS